MTVLRKLFFIAAQNNFTVTIKHLPGTKNSIADAISRMQFQRFFLSCPTGQQRSNGNSQHFNSPSQRAYSVSFYKTYRSGIKKFLKICDQHPCLPLASIEGNSCVFCSLYKQRAHSSYGEGLLVSSNLNTQNSRLLRSNLSQFSIESCTERS